MTSIIRINQNTFKWIIFLTENLGGDEEMDIEAFILSDDDLDALITDKETVEMKKKRKLNLKKKNKKSRALPKIIIKIGHTLFP